RTMQRMIQRFNVMPCGFFNGLKIRLWEGTAATEANMIPKPGGSMLKPETASMPEPAPFLWVSWDGSLRAHAMWSASPGTTLCNRTPGTYRVGLAIQAPGRCAACSRLVDQELKAMAT